MKFSYPLNIVMSAAALLQTQTLLAAAQSDSLPGLPVCLQMVAQSQTAKSGCANLDFSCACKVPKTIEAINLVLSSYCSPEDSKIASQWISDTCKFPASTSSLVGTKATSTAAVVAATAATATATPKSGGIEAARVGMEVLIVAGAVALVL